MRKVWFVIRALLLVALIYRVGVGMDRASAEQPTLEQLQARKGGPVVVITEDSPQWDCQTMGNFICGTDGTDDKRVYLIRYAA